ncbi:hypothetical protein ANN_21088 [Periplaneta americana]|uniref:Reverse transcriptase domain-containing protein n=1 Tax=Periplaneta americana TaxID=6978 RepID=A0ABQ8SF18_PERAM|nr:hypothetical protein ANN_21088 [Periplaneta americana]
MIAKLSSVRYLVSRRREIAYSPLEIPPNMTPMNSHILTNTSGGGGGGGGGGGDDAAAAADDDDTRIVEGDGDHFFDSKEMIYQHAVPPHITVTGAYYSSVWAILRKHIARKRQLHGDEWRLHHDNAPHIANQVIENTQTIRENTEILLEASRAIGLEVNPEKTKYMIMSRDQNIVRNGNIKIGVLSFEEVEKFKYLGATVTNINDTREEIKRRINMGNACYYSVEKLLSSSLLSKNLKVRIYKTVILPVLLYGCETWTLTLREEHRFRAFENKVLRKIFGAKRDEVTGE